MKVHGKRLELEEIESILQSIPNVIQAAGKISEEMSRYFCCWNFGISESPSNSPTQISQWNSSESLLFFFMRVCYFINMNSCSSSTWRKINWFCDWEYQFWGTLGLFVYSNFTNFSFLGDHVSSVFFLTKLDNWRLESINCVTMWRMESSTTDRLPYKVTTKPLRYTTPYTSYLSNV